MFLVEFLRLFSVLKNMWVFSMVKFLQVEGYERYFKKSSFTLGATI